MSTQLSWNQVVMLTGVYIYRFTQLFLLSFFSICFQNPMKLFLFIRSKSCKKLRTPTQRMKTPEDKYIQSSLWWTWEDSSYSEGSIPNKTDWHYTSGHILRFSNCHWSHVQTQTNTDQVLCYVMFPLSRGAPMFPFKNTSVSHTVSLVTCSFITMNSVILFISVY